MKTLITTMNAKYIHKSLALRLLYVSSKEYIDVDFKEYTIKDSVEHIVEDILKQNIQIVAFSTYIWNVEMIIASSVALKQQNPDIIIILGGPEVSYDIDYFLDNYPIDYIISGEGEIVFRQLVEAISNDQKVMIQGVSTFDNRDYRQSELVSLDYIESLPSPYLIERDLSSMHNRILYMETSRGCPYRCQYCLSSLEKGLRFFSLEYLEKQIKAVCNQGVKTLKFLDRSFNAKSEHAIAIIDMLIKYRINDMQCQFEINGDVLDQKIIDHIHKVAPKGMFRFEIGIQSTHEPTNEIVQRYQNFERLKEVIEEIQQVGIVDLHLDLIAGLPLETVQRFSKSFDDVFGFHPKELQLGFLKLLRGTSLRIEANKYGYNYQENAPYELIDSNDLSKQDIQEIHIVEDMLEKYWNSGKCPKAMDALLLNYTSAYTMFLEIGTYYIKNNCKTIHYQTDELFQYLNAFSKEKGFDIEDELIEDYLSLSKVKPKIWWKPRLDKKQTNEIIHVLVATKNENQELLFRYSKIEKLKKYYIVAIYKNFITTIKKFDV